MRQSKKIHPIGKVEYDEDRQSLTFVDGVIEETQNRNIVDPQERTYFGVMQDPCGSYEINESFYLRKRSPAEAMRDLENILAREPTISEIVKNTPLRKLPKEIAKHLYRQASQETKWQTTHIKRAVRKRLLQWRLKKADIVLDNLDNDTAEYENSALRYVWYIASEVLEGEGAQTEIFDEVANKLLSKKERLTMIKNVQRGENPRWGIASAEDRRYQPRKVTELYKTAKAIVERYEIEEDEYVQSCKDKVENSPLFRLAT